MKLNLTKITITLVLAFLVYTIGIISFHNPIWLKTGCKPDPRHADFCAYWRFPENINLYSAPLLVILYISSVSAYSVAQKRKKLPLLNSIILLTIILCILGTAGYLYYGNWQGNCRAFYVGPPPKNPVYRQTELRCPELLDPFTWKKFVIDWEKTNPTFNE